MRVVLSPSKGDTDQSVNLLLEKIDRSSAPLCGETSEPLYGGYANRFRLTGIYQQSLDSAMGALPCRSPVNAYSAIGAPVCVRFDPVESVAGYVGSNRARQGENGGVVREREP